MLEDFLEAQALEKLGPETKVTLRDLNSKLKELPQDSSQRPLLLIFSGYGLLAQGTSTDACKAFEEVRKLPALPPLQRHYAALGLARCLASSGKSSDAQAVLQAALNEPGVAAMSPSLLTDLARLQFRNQDPLAACKLLESASKVTITRSHQQFDLLLGLGKCHHFAKRYAMAARSFESATRLPQAALRQSSMALQTELGWNLYLDKAPKKACTRFSNVLKLAQESPRDQAGALFGLIYCHRAQGKFAEAIQFAQQYLELPLKNAKKEKADVLTLKAWIHLENKDSEAACLNFKKALRELPASQSREKSLIHQVLSQCSKEQQDLTEANKEIALALQQAPPEDKSLKLDLLLDRGWLEIQTHSPRSACSTFEEARSLHPESVRQQMRVAQGQARCHRDQYESETALNLIDDALKLKVGDLKPETAELLLLRGEILRTQRKHELSRKSFEQALHLVKESPLRSNELRIRIHSELARHYRTKKPEQALGHYKEILRLAPKDSPAYLATSRLEFNQQLNLKVAKGLTGANTLALLKEAARRAEKDEEFLLSHPLQELFTSAFEKLSERPGKATDTALKTDPLLTESTLFSHFFWGNFHLAQGDVPAARRRFESMLTLKAGSFAAEAGLANAAARESHHAEVLLHYMKAKRLAGSHWYHYLQRPLSETYSKILTGKSPEMLSAEVKLVSPFVSEYRNVLYSALGDAYLVNGKLDAAEAAYSSALNDDRSSARAHLDWPQLGIALVAIHRGNFALADEYASRALKISDNSTFDLQRLAKAYQSVNQPEKAREYFEKTAAIMNDELQWGPVTEDLFFNQQGLTFDLSETYLQLAELALGDGNEDMAARYYEKVLELEIGPHRESAEKGLSNLRKLKQKRKKLG